MKKIIFVLALAFSLGLVSRVDAGLIGYWNFDEGTGTIAHDSSSNGYDGTINGGANWTTGKFGNALDFDRISNYISILGSENADISSGLTIEAWVKFDDVSPQYRRGQTIVSKWGVGDRAFYLGKDQHSEKFEYDLWADGDVWIVGPSSPLYSNASPVAGVWTYVAATYDGSTAKFFLDGNLDVSNPATGLIHQGGYPIEIGGVGRGDSHYFDGIIDEVRIYNNALTQEEIFADMNSGVIPEPTTLSLLGLGLLGLVFRRKKTS